MRIYCICIYTSYCVAEQHHLPQKTGNLPVKKKHIYIIPPAPGASKVTKLEPGGHFVCRNLFFAAIWSKIFFESRNHTFLAQNVCPKSIRMIMNGVPVAPHGLILGEDGATASGKLSKHLQAPFPPAWDPKTSKNIENRRIGENI